MQVNRHGCLGQGTLDYSRSKVQATYLPWRFWRPYAKSDILVTSHSSCSRERQTSRRKRFQNSTPNVVLWRGGNSSITWAGIRSRMIGARMIVGSAFLTQVSPQPLQLQVRRVRASDCAVPTVVAICTYMVEKTLRGRFHWSSDSQALRCIEVEGGSLEATSSCARVLETVFYLMGVVLGAFPRRMTLLVHVLQIPRQLLAFRYSYKVVSLTSTSLLSSSGSVIVQRPHSSPDLSHASLLALPCRLTI